MKHLYLVSGHLLAFLGLVLYGAVWTIKNTLLWLTVVLVFAYAVVGTI